MEFWQQLALAALGGGVVTGIVVSLLNNWFEAMRDDRRWKREQEERREQWEREKEERQEQRTWMLREDIRQQRREWRRERLEPVLEFLDALAMLGMGLTVYSAAEKVATDIDEVKAMLEEIRATESIERLRTQVGTQGLGMLVGIDDPELRQLILDLTIDLFKEAPPDQGKIDAARKKVEQLVIEVS